jgi:predicted DNA-binding protein with PD1-like motif
MKATRTGEQYLIAIDMGEELMSTLLQFASSEGLTAGYLSGIGALKDVELGYYWLDRREYKRQKFPEIVELVGCTGNLALKEGKPFVHIHVALGREDYSIFGGHLFSGIVAVTAEIVLHSWPQAVSRAFDEKAGLFLLDLPACKAG